MDKFDFDNEIDLEEDQEIEIKEPDMYRVFFHNDNYTTMEFVMFVLEQVFHKSKVESFLIMMDVHEKGIALVGVYTYEVASTNVYLVQTLAEECEYPFLVTIEKV